MDAKREWKLFQLARCGFLESAEDLQARWEDGGRGGAGRTAGAGAGGLATDVGSQVVSGAEVGSMIGVNAGYFGEAHDEEMTEGGVDDVNNDTDYVSMRRRSDAACTKVMEEEWMFLRKPK